MLQMQLFVEQPLLFQSFSSRVQETEADYAVLINQCNQCAECFISEDKLLLLLYCCCFIVDKCAGTNL